jgi:PAS domain S-box-containing protein
MFPLDSPGSSPRAAVLGYATALAAIGIGALMVQADAPVSTLMLAIIAATWFGGTRPGALAAAVSLPVLFHFTGTEQLPRVAYFAGIAAFIIWLINSLRRNETELRNVVDGIPAMAWILLPDGRVEFLNRRWLEYAGLALGEAITRSNETMHPDDFQRVVARWRERLAAGQPYEDEMRLRRADGEYRWFLVRTVPQRDEQGNIVRWYGTSTDIEDRRRAEQALRDSAERLQQLSRRLLEVQEAERRHLARELHDEFGQVLAAISVRLQAAKNAAAAPAHPNLDECIGLLQRAGERVRSLALELRPTMLETAGLDAALRWLAEQHLQQTGTPVQIAGHVGQVSGEVAIACFRVAQEALTNVMRHAGARQVSLTLNQTESEVELTVRDDGAGFDVQRTLREAGGRARLGLLGMKERVEILRGRLELDSRPGGGTRVRISLPVHA